MTASVTVDLRKWPDTPHRRFPARPIGEDEHGRWLWAPAGTTIESGSRGWVLEHAMVSLITDGWWAATWFATGVDELYVDVVAPAEWTESAVRLIDLDLDVVRFRDGRTGLHDEDEFEANRLALGYPPEFVANARETADRILAAMLRGDEPFGGVGEAWLARALAQSEASPR